VRHGAICQSGTAHAPPAYNRFVRWRRAGVWGRIMDALAIAHDESVQMIDTSIESAS
jgi:transposase